ncbi:MAG: VWA domain-containing protein, partial [Sphingobacteriales bacterium]
MIHDTDIIRQVAKYIEQDSFTVAASPDLIRKAKVKLEPGSIVYLYKQSEHKKSMLIGGLPGATADSMPGNIYGWISKNALTIWGERAALKLGRRDSSGAFISLKRTAQDSVPLPAIIDATAAAQRSSLAGIFPMSIPGNVIPDTGVTTRFYTNTFDYENNKIYNVLGDRMHFSRYREILQHNRKLNIVFVLDLSRNNRLYLPVVKSLLQELQLGFAAPGYFSRVSFGGVAYKQNDCGISPMHSPLSTNYTHIANFFEEKMEQLQCSDTGVEQPVSGALREAAQMLSGVIDETNIIVVLGTTADQQVQRAILAATGARARLIFFQTQNKSADAYNDFVLLAQKTVVNSA